MPLGNVVEPVLSVLGYPHRSHRLLNTLSERTTLRVAPSAQIAPRCLLRGTVELRPNVRVSARSVLSGDVTVGRGTNLEPACELIGDVEIGNYCAIARETIFQESNHQTGKPSIQRRLYETVLDSELPYTTKGPITVGSDVWFGARAIVLSGVSIGHGAVVAAGSVVTRDVEPYAIVAGTPAERVGWRFPEEIRDALLDLEWWEWDETKLRNHQEFFDRELQSADDVPVELAADTHTASTM